MSVRTRKIKCPTCGAPAGKMCRSVTSNKPLPDEHATRCLISINEAAKSGHSRLRKPIWSNPFDHIKIDIFDGRPGQWIHVFSPANKEINGRDPVDLLAGTELTPLDAAELEIYDGPLPDSDEYQKAVKAFSEMIEGTNKKMK